MVRRSLVSRSHTALARLLGFVLLSCVCGALVAAYFVPQLAAAGAAVNGSLNLYNGLPSDLAVRQLAQTTRILTSDGKLIASFYAENRVRVALKQMSPYIKDAVVAIEDSRFYEHSGVDPVGVLRALVSNVSGGDRQGASTLTQQYVTNV